jgi:hypothetical protein
MYSLTGKNSCRRRCWCSLPGTYVEFNVINMTFTGSVNSADNILIGNISDNNPGDAEPLWYLTKP